MTLRDHKTITVRDDDGTKKQRKCNERYFVPSGLTWMLKYLDFKTVDLYGAKLGAFSRNDSLTPDDFEILVIAKK